MRAIYFHAIFLTKFERRPTKVVLEKKKDALTLFIWSRRGAGSFLTEPAEHLWLQSMMRQNVSFKLTSRAFKRRVFFIGAAKLMAVLIDFFFFPKAWVSNLTIPKMDLAQQSRPRSIFTDFPTMERMP